MMASKDNAHGKVGVNVTELGGEVTDAANINELPTNYAPDTCPVQASIAGQRLAEQFLQSLQSHYPDPDHLLHLIESISRDSCATSERETLRGLCRGIQKAVERNVRGGR